MEDYDEHNIEVALVDKELMHIVFGFLDFTDLSSVSAVCRRWQVLARADEVMRVLVQGRVLSMGTADHTGLGYAPAESSEPNRWRMITRLARETIVQVATTPEIYDKHHTLAVTENGAVYAFGDTTDDKLGFQHGSNPCYAPQIVAALADEKIVKRGTVDQRNCFHLGGNGRLGERQAERGENDFSSRMEPAEVTRIGGDESVRPFIVDLWCGKAVTLLLDRDGLIRGSLGREASGDGGGPMPVAFPPGVRIKSAAYGGGHGLAITTDGQVYSWGTGSALGHGAPGELDGPNPPRLIEALAHAKVAQVACGPLHSLVLTEDNVLYSFGYSQGGILGHSERPDDSAVPQVVDAVAGLGTITAISAASGQSVVLFESGRVLGFGEFKGELKKESWLVPRSVCAGAGGVFLLC
ncbi:Fbox domain containing protein [Acanthamoeba castellanii str. Neff]|uniref:Fbox domain containing protein n=1 Tax=Acanthamoeba castellanii (strain ATCC 30010 / Neff) TaxID=1257118 RepID=L8H108_ACACF|nr:Fbox domain containing protein [Acanthamoeba castellanii str. Neff]ELR18041.1 Fbox domain containing protein [Acanthamoeba castellanii str. Neff]